MKYVGDNLQIVTFTVVTESYDNPDEAFSDNNSRIRELIDVWPGTADARVTAYSTFLGGSSLQDNGTQRWISRQRPKPYSPFLSAATGTPFLFCTSIMGGRPFGVGTPAAPLASREAVDAAQGTGRMEVIYTTLPYQVLADTAVLAGSGPLNGKPDEGWVLANSGITATRYIEKQIDHGGKFFTVRAGAIWVQIPGGARKVLNMGIPVSEPTQTITYIQYGIPLAAFPQNAIQKTMGRVNDALFDGYAAGTLLYLGCGLRQYNNPFGQRVIDAAHRMLYKPATGFTDNVAHGHNYILEVYKDPGTGVPTIDYLQMWTDKAAGSQPYKAMPMDAVFRPDQP